MEKQRKGKMADIIAMLDVVSVDHHSSVSLSNLDVLFSILGFDSLHCVLLLLNDSSS